MPAAVLSARSTLLDALDYCSRPTAEPDDCVRLLHNVGKAVFKGGGGYVINPPEC